MFRGYRIFHGWLASIPIKFHFLLFLWSTPAVRPSDRTLFILTGLFEPGELARLPFLASDQSDVAELGVNGFGSFCRNKRTSASGPRPGIKFKILQSGKLSLGYAVEILSLCALFRYDLRNGQRCEQLTSMERNRGCSISRAE